MKKVFALGAGSVAMATLVGLFACGGGDDGTGTTPEADAASGSLDGSSGGLDATGASDAGAAQTFTVSATVTGLAGSGLVLKDQSGAKLPVTAPPGGGSTKVTFPTKLSSGAAFEVTVDAQPSSPPQTCVVTGGKGTVAVGDVTSVTVNCTTLYTVGGTVTGLAGKDLVLENNGGADSVTINANGQFAFPKPLAGGQAYAVTVKKDPTNKWQTCKVSVGDAGSDAGASGVVGSANITNIDVVCVTNKYDVAVKVTGLAGTGLVFQNKGADDLAVAANGTFTFASKVESGAEYDVKAFAQPTNPWQVCTVTNGKALVAGANVTLDVACATSTFKVGGTLSGLQGNGLVLQDNAGDDLTLNANQNGAFAFATPVESGKPYAVTIKTQPNGVAGEQCYVTSGTGTVAGADVTTVAVACSVTKKVFVTSTQYTGNLGGLDGADAKCQARAQAANLPGTYRAWLSDNTGSPSTRFTQSTVPYVLVDGTKVANNWADLIDGNLVATITKTELGGNVPLGNTSCAGGGYPTVWSNTSTSGAQLSTSLSCSNWTNEGNNGGSAWGRANDPGASWTTWCSGGICSWTSPLYCFQQ